MATNSPAATRTHRSTLRSAMRSASFWVQHTGRKPSNAGRPMQDIELPEIEVHDADSVVREFEACHSRDMIL